MLGSGRSVRTGGDITRLHQQLPDVTAEEVQKIADRWMAGVAPLL
jgi:hypothetical protein